MYLARALARFAAALGAVVDLAVLVAFVASVEFGVHWHDSVLFVDRFDCGRCVDVFFLDGHVELGGVGWLDFEEYVEGSFANG